MIRASKLRLAALIALFLLLILSAYIASKEGGRLLTVSFLDVGQGDAILTV